MRGVIVVCALLLAAVASAGKNWYNKIVDECIEELDLKTNERGRPDREDAEKKCLAKCIGVKAKFIDNGGKLLEENIPENMRKVTKECDEKVMETDACKRAEEMMKCVRPKRQGGKGKGKKDKDE